MMIEVLSLIGVAVAVLVLLWLFWRARSESYYNVTLPEDVREEIRQLNVKVMDADEKLKCAQQKFDVIAGTFEEHVPPVKKKLDHVREVLRETSRKLERMNRAIRP